MLNVTVACTGTWLLVVSALKTRGKVAVSAYGPSAGIYHCSEQACPAPKTQTPLGFAAQTVSEIRLRIARRA